VCLSVCDRNAGFAACTGPRVRTAPRRVEPRPELLNTTGLTYKISYDLSQDYRKFIVRSTYDSYLNVLKPLLGISLANLRTLS